MAIERGGIEPRLPSQIQVSSKKSKGASKTGRAGKSKSFGVQKKNLIGLLRVWNPIRKDRQHMKELTSKLSRQLLGADDEGNEMDSVYQEMKEALQELDFRVSTNTSLDEGQRETAIRALEILQEEVENQNFIASLRRTLYRA